MYVIVIIFKTRVCIITHTHIHMFVVYCGVCVCLSITAFSWSPFYFVCFLLLFSCCSNCLFCLVVVFELTKLHMVLLKSNDNCITITTYTYVFKRLKFSTKQNITIFLQCTFISITYRFFAFTMYDLNFKKWSEIVPNIKKNFKVINNFFFTKFVFNMSFEEYIHW